MCNFFFVISSSVVDKLVRNSQNRWERSRAFERGFPGAVRHLLREVLLAQAQPALLERALAHLLRTQLIQSM